MSDQPAKPDRVEEALRRFKVCVAAEKNQRARELEDLRFQIPEYQWPDEVRDQRKAQAINGVTLSARPMLAIPKLDQPIQLVLNQEKAAHLGVQVHPLTEDSDDDTAEVLQGLYRAIEVDSRANLARSWAFERALKAGRGAYRILKEYDDDSDHPSDQKIVIKRVYEQGAVYFDPAASEPDASDAQYAFVVEDVPLQTYKRLYPKSTLTSYNDQEFADLGNEKPGWITGEKDAIAIRVAEYFYLEYEEEELEWDGGSRTRQRPVVHWCTLNAVEELDAEVWDGRYIPLVRVVGQEVIPFDGEKRVVGIISKNKDAQRLFNYAASASVEMAALETKASHAVDPDQIKGFEAFWQQKNTRNFPYLPVRRFINGQDYGPPVPIQADMSKMQVNAMLLAQASDFIHAGTSAFEPSLGQQSPNVKTKGATLALQQQSDQANAHWLDNLAEISMTHEARIVLDLIPKVYDRPGRVARILDGEDNTKQVMLNAPFQMQGKRPVGLAGMPPGQPQTDVKHYDLTKGRYGVTITIGKAYKSRVEEGKGELAQLFQAEPQLFNLLGDLYLKFADFPGHREAAERVKKMLPPQLQDQEGQQDPKLQLDQAKAALAQLQQQAQQMAKALETDQVKAQAQIQTAREKATIDASTTLAIQKMKDATSIAVAQINAAVKIGQQATEARNEAIALGQEHAFTADQAQKDRQHELSTIVQQHQQALEAAQQGHQHAMAQAAQGGQIDAARAAQDHAGAMEQADQQGQIASEAAQQQADLNPPAEPSAE